MPFTPFHLGPGLLFKAIGGPRFSFMVFGGAQVLMDIEPLLGLLGRWPAVHGVSHTLPGALAIGTVAGLVGRPVSARVLRWLHVPHAPFTWTASFVGAYVGTFSHVLFDAFMHSDMAPAWPLAGGNPLLGQVGTGPLHVACMLAGVVGAVGVAIRCRAWRQA